MLKNFTGKLTAGLIVSVALWYYSGNYWNAHWHSKWAYMMYAVIFMVGGLIGGRTHWSVAPVIWSTLAGSISVFAWHGNVFSNMELTQQLALMRDSAYAGFSFLLLSTFFVVLPKKNFKWVEDGLACVCFIESCLIISEVMRPVEARGGSLGNPSMTACFIAGTYPFLVMQARVKLHPPRLTATLKRFVYLTFPVLAVFLTMASMPVGTLAVVIGAWAIAKYPPSKKWWAFGGLALGAVGLAAWLQGADVLFNTSGRMAVWKMGIQWWWDTERYYFGMGTGTTQFLLPKVQATMGHYTYYIVDWYLWFHNEYLQTLFEQGVVGGVVVFNMWVWAMVKAYRRPYLFAALAGYAGMATGNYPVHLPLHAFLGVALIAIAFRCEDNVCQNSFDEIT